VWMLVLKLLSLGQIQRPSSVVPRHIQHCAILMVPKPIWKERWSWHQMIEKSRQRSKKLRHCSYMETKKKKKQFAKMLSGTQDPRSETSPKPNEDQEGFGNNNIEDDALMSGAQNPDMCMTDASQCACDEQKTEGLKTSKVEKLPSANERIVHPVNLGVQDEARKLDVAVRELTYAWQQTEEDIKIYVPFDQSSELSCGVDEQRVQVEYGEWSILLLIHPTTEGLTPLGLRLGDFHRRIDPENCKCIIRNSRISVKLAKKVKEHWWNLLQHVPLNAG